MDSPVPLEIDQVFIEIVDDATVRDVPELDGAIFAGAGDNVVVERVPFYVQHRPAVAADLRGHVVKTADLQKQ